MASRKRGKTGGTTRRRKTYYFIGKDNIPFHAIIWPAQLMGAERLYEDDLTKTFNLPTMCRPTSS